MSALLGNLRDFGMGEVFQLIGQQRKTGVLRAEGPDGRIDVMFDGGHVVSANYAGLHPGAALGDMLVRLGMMTPERLTEVERARASTTSESFERLVSRLAEIPLDTVEEVKDVITQEALFDLLRWSYGSFEFSAHPVTHAKRQQDLLPAEQILMDGLRMVDEWQSFPPEVRDERAVFARSGPFDNYREAFTSETLDWISAAERLYMLVDGRSTVRRVVDLSRLGTFEGCRILSGLLTCGAIEPGVESRSGLVMTGLDVVHSGAFRWLGFASLALLLGAACLIAAPNEPVAPDGVIALRNEPLTTLAARFETLRARRLADAAAVAYPGKQLQAEDLQALAPEGSPLWGSGGAPYYHRGENGISVVLAPEH